MLYVDFMDGLARYAMYAGHGGRLQNRLESVLAAAAKLRPASASAGDFIGGGGGGGGTRS